jgi:osmotically-inducible protein OsmY
MTTALLTDRDLRTRKFVTQQLEWDPAVDASAIGVAARDGAVTLTGFVNTFAEKLAAERAAKRVHGVRAVANDLEVKLKLGRTDADIARDVAMGLRIYASIPATVQAAVHHGHVTLTGTVSWLYQKLLAEKTAAQIDGVRHVINYISVLRPLPRRRRPESSWSTTSSWSNRARGRSTKSPTSIAEQELLIVDLVIW